MGGNNQHETILLLEQISGERFFFLQFIFRRDDFRFAEIRQLEIVPIQADFA